MKDVTFKFENDAAAAHFLSWLCESGEQGYWQWMECREAEEDGPITAVSFEYHPDGIFGGGPIVATCGRLDTP